MTNTELIEISTDEMEQANGGYIVYRGKWRWVWIVDDYTGKVMNEEWFLCDAKTYCKVHTQSDKIITEKQYEEMLECRKKGLPDPF